MSQWSDDSGIDTGSRFGGTDRCQIWERRWAGVRSGWSNEGEAPDRSEGGWSSRSVDGRRSGGEPDHGEGQRWIRSDLMLAEVRRLRRWIRGTGSAQCGDLVRVEKVEKGRTQSRE